MYTTYYVDASGQPKNSVCKRKRLADAIEDWVSNAGALIQGSSGESVIEKNGEVILSWSEFSGGGGVSGKLSKYAKSDEIEEVANLLRKRLAKRKKWRRIDNAPITSQTCVAVVNDEGEEGLVSVRWAQTGAFLYGGVYRVDGFDDIEGVEKITVIDDDPEIMFRPGPQSDKGRDPLRSIRVPDDEWEKWGQAAAKCDLTTTKWIRKVAGDAIK